MSLIEDLTPLNIEEERDKFFADTTYNPQFKYERSFTPEELTQWGRPKTNFYNHALYMIEQVCPTPDDSEKSKKRLKLSAIQKRVDEFNSNLKKEDKIQVDAKKDVVSKCKLSGNVMCLRTPITYLESEIDGLIYHELETHYLRKINQRIQPWTGEPRTDKSFRSTEEGMAILHTYLGNKREYMDHSFTAYIGLYLAQELSFADVFKKLTSYKVPADRAFRLCLRAKRGLEDTTQPGGLTKDITYLEGAVAVWRWICDENNDPHDLYIGRIGLEEIIEKKQVAETKSLVYPSFLQDTNLYRESIRTIGTRNQLEKI